MVTVSGTAHQTTNLHLNIDSGVTVNWNATLTGNATANNYLLTLSGSGTFTLGGGATIDVTTGAGGTVYISGGVTLNVTDGTIQSSGSGSAVTIVAGVLDAKINVNGANGKILSVPNGYAINDGSGMTSSSNNTKINISDGLVESGSACAIRSTGIESVVTVSGGVVRNNAASNTNSTIYMNYSPSPNSPIDNIIVSGGLVETTNPGNQSYVLQTSQNVLVNGGEVKAIAGRAINLVGEFSTTTVTSGRVSTVSGTAISTATTTLNEVDSAKIVISGGTVEATGTGTAVRITGYNSTVEISGSAKVLATSGLAIDASGRPAADSVTVDGGLVFAWGNAVNKVISPEGKLSTPVTGVVVAWNTATGTGEYPYIQNASNDLSMLPAGSVFWDNEPLDTNNGGIRYGTDFHTLDVGVIQNTFILTIVNGTADGGETSLLVTAGNPVDIVTHETPIATAGINPNSNPINGNRFVNWTTDGGGTFSDASLMDSVFTMPASNVTVTANFKPLYVFRITGGSIDAGNRNFDGSTSYGYYAEGDIINITAFSQPWGTVPGWLKTTAGGAFGDANSTATTFTMPGEPVTVYVDPSTAPNPANRPQQYTTTVENGIINSTSTGVPINAATGDFYAGTRLNITAAHPVAGKVFSGWTMSSGTGGSFVAAGSTATVFVTPDRAVTITANYTDKTYHLTVNGGTGADGPHVSEAVIPITAATPQTGMVFSGWTIDNGSGIFADPSLPDTTFTISDNDAVVTAHFEFLEYTLTVENGVDVLGVGVYHYEETIPVSADPPSADMVFNQWIIVSGGGSFTSASASDAIFTMPAGNATIMATYTKQNTEPPIPPVTDPPTFRVTVNDSYTYPTGAGNYTHGSVVTIHAGARSGYTFTGWTVVSGGVTLFTPNSGITTFVMPAGDVTVRANWTLTPPPPTVYQLHVNDSYASTTGTGTYAPGSVVTINAGAIDGYTFTGWTVVSGGVTLANSNSATTTFTMPANDVIVRANWTQTPPPPSAYTVTVNDSYASPTGAGTYTPGSVVTINAGTRSGYTFTGWTIVSGGVTLANSSSATTTFTMPANDVTVRANWTQTPPVTYHVTVNDSYTSTTGAGTYTSGNAVTIHAGVRDGYTFTGWTVVSGGVTLANSNSATTTFTMPASDVTVRANWESEWALANLALCIAGAVTALAASVYAFFRKRKDSGGTRKTVNLLWLLVAVIAGTAGVIVFFLTENMNNPMRLVDWWTIVNFVLFVIVFAGAVLALRSTNDRQKRNSSD